MKVEGSDRGRMHHDIPGDDQEFDQAREALSVEGAQSG
jgi:hypothetical protein